MSDFYDFTTNPNTVWLTVNRACNFRCKWCYAEGTGYESTDNMSLEMAKELAILVKELGVNHITLIGGEPTMWPHLLEFNDFARTVGMTTSIVTNAFKFGDDKYWARYLESPCDGVGVSIKGVTAEQMRRITGVPHNAIDATLENTNLGIRRAIASHKNVNIGTVYSSLTSNDDIIEIAEVAKKLGAKTFTLSPCGITMQDGVPSTEYVITPEALISGIIELYSSLDRLFGKDFTIEMSLPYCMWPADFIDKLLLKGQLTSECHVHDRSGLVFDHDGNVLFCNNMYDVCVARYGSNFTDRDTLLGYLNSQQVCDEYAEILRYPAPCCSDCIKNDICRGGCNINWTVLDPAMCKAI